MYHFQVLNHNLKKMLENGRGWRKLENSYQTKKASQSLKITFSSNIEQGNLSLIKLQLLIKQLY